MATTGGSYTGARAHLLKLPGKGIGVCKKITSQKLSQLQNENDAAELRIKNAYPKNVPLPPSSVSIGSSCAYESKKKSTCASGSGSALGSGSGSGSGSAIEKAFNMKDREQLHFEIARMGTWKEKGVSIVSYGWSDSQRRSLINFMAVSESGPMFIKAVDCFGETKDKYFIANLMKEVINEVGASNVKVITDNAHNCKAAGQLIEAQFSHILWTPCVMHTLNLVLKNICAAKNIKRNEVTYEECSWISDIAGDGLMIKNFISNHSMRLAMYNEFVS
ncbi:uncharacterized protein LOC114289548 [Camellia sinensis]|uniref:uncharacterized protein LOC114289548 n=1 Tax=Camellia sinensis TaxID=4442 RepID=UPI00103613A1|nr:uncharacterized protein LOC114289548 [Camellia sinensis]